MARAKIFTFGECLLDIIFKDGQAVASRPGGSMLNAAVTIGRLGSEVFFIGDTGKDRIGSIIRSFLSENGVGLDYFMDTHERSTISLAFLDDKKNSSYLFFNPNDAGGEQPLAVLRENDVLMFGSFFPLREANRKRSLFLINAARDAGSMIYYDLNFRATHLKDLQNVRPYIKEYMRIADIVKGSDEDFTNVFATTNVDETWSILRDMGCRYLIYTQNSRPVYVCSSTAKREYKVPPLKPVSTIGAGDTFNAGVAYGLMKAGITRSRLSKCTWACWDTIIGRAIRFSADVCKTYDNYLSNEAVLIEKNKQKPGRG